MSHWVGKTRPSAELLNRALVLLFDVLNVPSSTPADLARDLPRSTSYRLLRAFRDAGFLHKAGRGHYIPGPTLLALSAKVSSDRIAAELARPLLLRLARNHACTAHLGILRADMVEYLVRETADQEGIFTTEGMRLEAYCSAIGKILLGTLPRKELDTYLHCEPFVPLTGRTIIDANDLSDEVKRCRAAGFAIDDREVAADIYCLAVPIAETFDGRHFAVSLSMRNGYRPNLRDRKRHLDGIRKVTSAIAERWRDYTYGSQMKP